MLDVVPVLRDRQEAMVRANQILSPQMERVAGCSRHAATWTAARPNNKTRWPLLGAISRSGGGAPGGIWARSTNHPDWGRGGVGRGASRCV